MVFSALSHCLSAAGQPRQSFFFIWMGLLAAGMFSAPVSLRSQTIPSDGLRMWLKADAGVTQTGGRVSAWQDQSGNGVIASQTNSISQPTLISNAVNGRPVIRFDGVNSSLNFILPVDGLTGVTLIIVCSEATDTQGLYSGGESAPLFWGEDKDWGMLYLAPFQSNIRFRFGTGQPDILGSYVRPLSVAAGFTVTSAVKMEQAESLYVNGYNVYSWTSALSALSGVSSHGAIGRGSLRTFPGDIAEILVYDRALTDAERMGVEQVLLTRYNLAPAKEEAPAIQLSPTSDIQAAIDSNPEGTAFFLSAGIYRLVQLVPKNGDSFRGEVGTILNGAKLLTDFEPEDPYWVASDQTQRGVVYGDCLPDYPRCKYSDELYLNDLPLRHVASLAQVGPGTWYFDYEASRIYMGDDPTGQRVEASVVKSAFTGPADNVTISGITVEKYSSPAQMGAVGDQYPGANWTVENCEIRLNHGTGIVLRDGTRLLNSRIYKNGQMGLAASGEDVLIEGNEISFNHYAGFNPTWEAGAAKFSSTSKLVVRHNNSHDNFGHGFWTDGDNINTLYEGNWITNNAFGGISHEISYSAVIRSNTIRSNGTAYSYWVWGGQIQVQNSQNVEVYQNIVSIPAGGGNGIVLIHQSRGSGAYGPHLTINNYVHDNDVTYMGTVGLTGGAADSGAEILFSPGNVFNMNTYHVLSPLSDLWAWDGRARNWYDLRTLSQESAGAVDTSILP